MQKAKSRIAVMTLFIFLFGTATECLNAQILGGRVLGRRGGCCSQRACSAPRRPLLQRGCRRPIVRRPLLSRNRGCCSTGRTRLLGSCGSRSRCAPRACATPCATPVCSTPCATPVCSTPVVSTPVCSTPIVAAPVCSTPVVAAPVCSTPVYSAPVCSTPIVSAPISCAPVCSTPVPVCSTPVYSAPVCSTPVYSAPVCSTPVYSTPVCATPVPRCSTRIRRCSTPVSSCSSPCTSYQADLSPVLFRRMRSGSCGIRRSSCAPTCGPANCCPTRRSGLLGRILGR